MFKTSIGEHISEVSHKRIEYPNKSVYFNHIHNQAELLLFVSGKADYNIDGHIFKPHAYDLLFIPAATYHYLIPTESVPYENYVIGFIPSVMQKEKYEALFSTPRMMNIKDDVELRSYFSRLDNYRERFDDPDFKLCAEGLINQLLIDLCYSSGEMLPCESSSSDIIRDIVRYVGENLEENINADSISAHLMLSKSYVQNKFSQSMHIGLKKYIMQRKIYSAHADIAAGMPPSVACEKYRFGDYSSFYRLYKKHFSSSPKDVKDR